MSTTGQIPIYQVDAFASKPFSGNPAAVCLLGEWLPDDLMQAIAMENSLPETAFLVPAGDGYQLRWFNPAIEDDLCGHATLAAGFIVLTQLAPSRSEVQFETKSGLLTVSRRGELFALELPSLPPQPCTIPARIVAALGAQPTTTMAAVKYMAVFEDEAMVAALSPDFAALADIDRDGIIATAPGANCDFVSRYFAPHVGIPEDSVTGSAHCTLVPYWAERLGKSTLEARQISRRSGELHCRLMGERVILTGAAVLYMEGTIRIPSKDSDAGK